MDSSKSISFAITVCNEYDELKKLLDVLLKNLRRIDEIVILLDETKYTNEVKRLINSQSNKVRSFKYPLNMDFGNFKNQLNSHCNKDYIFQLDADEIVSKKLIYNVIRVINDNNIDLYFLPRLNSIWPIQQVFEYARRMGWKRSYHNQYYRKFPKKENKIYHFLNDRGLVFDEDENAFWHYIPIVNFPDYQGRIYKNNEYIKWHGKVHEIIKGHGTYVYLPKNNINYCLYHPKTIQKQQKQNKFYEQFG